MNARRVREIFWQRRKHFYHKVVEGYASLLTGYIEKQIVNAVTYLLLLLSILACM